MIRAFNIYPALFIITPHSPFTTLSAIALAEADSRFTMMPEETIQTKNQAYENEEGSRSEREENFRNWPQTFWGDCLFNENHMQLVLRFSSDMKTSPLQELLSGELNALEPAKFIGNRYTITYIPVLN